MEPRIEEIPGEFGFTVKVSKRWRDSTLVWEVNLPHQCDEWEIAYGHDGGREEAIGALEKFLAEGQAALEKLRTIEPPSDDPAEK